MATKATDNNAVIIPTINDYTFVKELGSGSQGVVNLYERKQDNKLFAIKQFSFDASQPFTTMQNCAMKEADLLTLPPEHKNIVRCFGSWLQNNRFYMKIEYLDS